MEVLTKSKGIIATVAIFILAMFLYNTFFKAETTSVISELSASKIGSDLIKTREELQKVVFDQALFSSIGYLKLTDFSVAIPQETTGRINPFNIIGRE